MLAAGAGHDDVFSAPRAIPFYDIAVFVTALVFFSHDMSQPFGKIKRRPSAACRGLRIRISYVIISGKDIYMPDTGI